MRSNCAPTVLEPEISSSKFVICETVIAPPIALAELYEMFPSFLVSTVPASTDVVCEVPIGIPIVPLFVSVSFTNILKPLVNRVAPEFTVRFVK
jgi:hypothetical protein